MHFGQLHTAFQSKRYSEEIHKVDPDTKTFSVELFP